MADRSGWPTRAKGEIAVELNKLQIRLAYLLDMAECAQRWVSQDDDDDRLPTSWREALHKVADLAGDTDGEKYAEWFRAQIEAAFPQEEEKEQ